MKNNLTYILLLLMGCLNAQVAHHIQYLKKVNVANTSVYTQHDLQIDPDQQLSNFLFKGLLDKFDSDTISREMDGNNENIVIVKKSDAPPPPITNQKNLKKNQLISYESIYGEKKFYLIKEDLPEFDWNIENETKEILGYQVQRATTHFRGREYEVWFAPAINLQDGPWKFYGLPGLILEAKSTDNFVEFLAYELHLNIPPTTLEELSTTYPKISPIDFTEKKAIEAKNVKQQAKYLESQNPSDVEVKIETNDLEIIN